MNRDLEHLRDSLIPKYGELVYNGFWLAPEREALQTFIDDSQKSVTGTMRLKLFKGNVTTVGRKSPYSLYDDKVTSMEGVKSDYNPDDATGFIRLQGVQKVYVDDACSEDFGPSSLFATGCQSMGKVCLQRTQIKELEFVFDNWLQNGRS